MPHRPEDTEGKRPREDEHGRMETPNPALDRELERRAEEQDAPAPAERSKPPAPRQPKKSGAW
jgi:hypothetical protein